MTTGLALGVLPAFDIFYMYGFPGVLIKREGCVLWGFGIIPNLWSLMNMSFHLLNSFKKSY